MDVEGSYRLYTGHMPDPILNPTGHMDHKPFGGSRAQRVHVTIWYISWPKRGSYILTLGSVYVL